MMGAAQEAPAEPPPPPEEPGTSQREPCRDLCWQGRNISLPWRLLSKYFSAALNPEAPSRPPRRAQPCIQHSSQIFPAPASLQGPIPPSLPVHPAVLPAGEHNRRGARREVKVRAARAAGIPKFLHHSLISADIQGPLVSRCILTNDC